jgi:hypothetical protein
VRGEWRYATDGRVLVRVPAPLIPSDGVNREQQPDVDAVLRGVDFTKCVEPMPPLRSDPHGEDKEEKCNCRMCADCDGTGGCVCPNCDNKHDCPTCDGLGRKGTVPDCNDCKGTNIIKTMRWKVQKVGAKYISCQFLSIINAELKNVHYYDDKLPDAMLCFVADEGVQGVLMPITPNLVSPEDTEVDAK